MDSITARSQLATPHIVGGGDVEAVFHEKLAIDHAVQAEAGQAAWLVWGSLPRDSRR